jgi:hypothetical protein|tara:strand:- start:1185 stop:1448 length:264 start_codon:yes stop_codon:yes gene_type:complete
MAYNKGPRVTEFTRCPGRTRKKAKNVWVGAQFLFGRPPHSMTMTPGNGVDTTEWTIHRTADDPEPIVINAPAKKAYDILIKMMRENQ